MNEEEQTLIIEEHISKRRPIQVLADKTKVSYQAISSCILKFKNNKNRLKDLQLALQTKKNTQLKLKNDLQEFLQNQDPFFTLSEAQEYLKK